MCLTKSQQQPKEKQTAAWSLLIIVKLQQCIHILAFEINMPVLYYLFMYLNVPL